MKKKISIIDVLFKEIEKEVVLTVEDGFSIIDLKPMGQMLVDSDHLSFIYIAEINDEYSYLTIPHSIWSQFKQALDLGSAVYLTDRIERIQLPGFMEELRYLIENIKENSNYGEEMVAKVESTF
ncbi:hypothetical protein F7731_06300 [Cytobacillus depressus]|uniref:Uncharacterized protein n=1 Tax=Cytobacillus depressus TaxID=1602942 RepID=A0A6L3V8K4_9BACI|nr:hypothetical protein [Cytobacillus depressus]KAB2337228.1 hypothetical protein F7731_06300 [Cytobacillus depressus]